MNWFSELRKALTSSTREEREFIERCSRLTPRACEVLRLARDEAVRLRHDFVGTEHMLLGLIRLGTGVAANVLAKMSCDLEAVRSEIEKQVGQGAERKVAENITLTPRAKRVIEIAGQEAKGLNHNFIGTEHLLLGLLEGDGVAGRVLNALGVNVEAARQQILKELDPNFTEGTSPDDPNS
jgi:ATP-dependent Clp protease ATP-binding subunit ClpC